MKRNTLALFLLFAATLFASAQTPITVGTATSKPLAKVYGLIDVPAGVDAGTKIWVLIVQGDKPGPTLALVSGAHGTEYAPIVALERLSKRLDPRDISGTV